MEQLANRLQDTISVHAVGHAGFSFKDHNNGRLFSLDEQISLKISYMESILAKDPETKLVLLGHSVGAYMVMEILNQRPDLPIVSNVFLFPALCNLEVSWPVKVLRTPILYESLGFCISLIPSPIKLLLSKLLPSIQDEATMIGDHFNSHSVRNGFSLVNHELRQIREFNQSQVKALTKHSDSSLFLFTRSDPYVGVTLMEHLRSSIPGATHIVYDDLLDVKHAFVMKDSDLVADTVLTYLDMILPGLCPTAESA
uniref:Serine aminopeptidase S33 domain-containing protein n=2 Tax=Spongospora subterranea TaxID=70186 RepID=A0A0H5QZW4_9EUKA|eukprot:CRZ01119.1 hypothetical protein [Spongospora subterranea]